MIYKVQMTRTVDIGQKERGEAPCRINYVNTIINLIIIYEMQQRYFHYHELKSYQKSYGYYHLTRSLKPLI